MSDQIITTEGFQKLQQELNNLISVRRREIAERIEKAKELGDLSENAEYADAKEAQAFNEGRIQEIQSILKNYTVVKNGGQKGIVSMGSRVTVKFDGKTKIYSIVSFNEVDPAEGKISNESPLGHAFLGHKKGDRIKVETPRGETEYEILKIE